MDVIQTELQNLMISRVEDACEDTEVKSNVSSSDSSQTLNMVTNDSKTNNSFCTDDKFFRHKASEDVSSLHPVSHNPTSTLNCDWEMSSYCHRNGQNDNILQESSESEEEEHTENKNDKSYELTKQYKKYNHVDHVVIKNSKAKCHLCNKDLPNVKNIDEHIKGSRHQKALAALQRALHTGKIKKANPSFSKEISSLVQNNGEAQTEKERSQENSDCLQDTNSVGSVDNICDEGYDVACGNDMQELEESYDLDEIKEGGQDSDEQNTEFQNIVSLGNNKFRCTVCQALLIGSVSVERHVIGKKHIKNLSITAVNIELLWKKVRELEGGKKNNIHMISLNNFRCTLCLKKIDVASVVSHVQGSIHQMKLGLTNQKKNANRKQAQTPPNIQSIWEEIFKAEGGRLSNIYLSSGKIFHCRPCGTQMAESDVLSHVIGESHQTAIMATETKEMNESLMRVANDIWQNLHASARTHEVFFKLDTSKTLYCTCCGVVLAFVAQNVLDHIRGKAHMNTSVKIMMSSPSQNKDDCETMRSESMQSNMHSGNAQEALVKALIPKERETPEEEEYVFHCLICDFEVESEDVWYEHTSSSNHYTNVAKLPQGKRLISYKCPFCNTALFCIASDKEKHNCPKKQITRKSEHVSKNTLQTPSENPQQEEQMDSVPRITVTGFAKGVGMEPLYSFFKEFGTVSFIAVTGDSAVIEFIERDAVRKTQENPLVLGSTTLTVKPLTHFDHMVPEPSIVLHESITSVFASMENFDKELNALNKMTSSVSNPAQSRKVCQFLEATFASLFPGCKALPFGSRVSGLAFPDSDMDIFLDTGGMYDGRQRQEAVVQELIVQVIENALKDLPDCENIEAVPKARTPIVRFYHKPSRMQCDLAFRHGLGCENTKLIRFYLSLDPRVKSLIIFLKQWANVHGLIGPCNITNYALTWLVIFYLQQASGFGLPPVEYLMKLHNGTMKTIAGWDRSFCTNKSLLPPIRSQQTVFQLLRGFFRHYQDFDFSKNVVCPLIGIPISKSFFVGDIHSLPRSMDSYVYRVSRNKHAERFRTQCSMCVQDPFDLSHNLTKGTPSAILKKFKILCGLSADICHKMLN
ncbi:uncharacterized protein [Periplaneta americana]|uniref:uncharacterized protein n=1 Tax=Periplaneta americana TaxID=6978 RepID=UPI0037E8CCA5